MAETFQNECEVSDKMDMLEYSEKNLFRALEIREKLLGPGHKLTELVRSELASLHASAFHFILQPRIFKPLFFLSSVAIRIICACHAMKPGMACLHLCFIPALLLQFLNFWCGIPQAWTRSKRLRMG